MNFLKKKGSRFCIRKDKIFTYIAVIHDNENGKKTELKYKNSSQNPENVDNININSKAKLNTVDNSIEYHHNQSHINNLIIGLPNSSAYCYLNSILQTLFSCQDFQDEIIEIYQESLNCVDQNKEFVISLGNLFHHMKERNKKEVENAVGRLYKHFDRTIYGDDIYKHYLQILKKINDEIKTPPESSEVYNKNSNSADEQFLVHKHKNNGFIFDLFCGQLSFKQKCDKCFKEFAGIFQLFKSIPLQIPLSSEKKPIIKCVESFFEESKIDGTSSECCNTGLFSFKEITHSPRFIFIYLLRRASNLPGSKNNTFIEFDNYINIPTEKVNVLYKLRSVIDHLSGNESGHYFVKTLLGSDWYLLNDVQVTKINPTDVPTKHSIGLLIEKVTNFDENIPQPLINYDENSFYQNGFQSILEIFYQCCPIRQYFIDLYNINKDNKTKNFKETLGQLFNSMRNKDEKEIINGVENLIQIFENSIDKDDIHKCFLQTLNKIYEETKLPQENNYSESENKTNISADDQFLVYKNKNNGLIFDNLFGQTSYETKCNNRECNIVFIKDYELFSSIQLELQSLKQNTPISECIEKHFANSKIKGANYQCCDKQYIISVCQITHSPQFIFIYLVRRNYNTFIEFDNYINIPTVNGNVLYKLRSVIDLCNDNTSGGHLVKMLIKSNWWLKKDYRVKEIKPINVPTKYTIGLLIEKVTKINHIVPETLLYCNYILGSLLSILQMLYLCSDIRICLINFYANNNLNENITENLIFKKKIGEVMYFLQHENESGRINKLLAEASNFLPNKIMEIQELYLCVMNKLNEKETHINSNLEYNDSMDESGYKGSRMHCENCNKYFDEISRPQIFKSFYLKSGNNKLNLSKRIENLCKSQLNSNNDFEKCCNDPKLVIIDEILSSPKYLLICFDGIERNIENIEEIILNTQSGRKHYFLQSLLDYSTITYSNGQTKRKLSLIKFDSKSFPKSKNLSLSIIGVMMVREDEYHPIKNSEKNYQGCGTDIRTKESCNSKPDLHNNLNNQHEIDEEKFESYFIAESIKQIIELNKDNKMYVLLGLLFSCTQFRNFMINLNRNNEIKKVFEKFALIESGKFIENVCNLYDHVIERKTISSFNKSDNNWTIQQCFNYIFVNIKLITENKEFREIFKSDNHLNSNFINDNFYGTSLLEVSCINCSNTKKCEDSFSNLCVKKRHKELSADLEKCLSDYFFEKEYQQEEKCCENAELFLRRKIIHSPPFLFICLNEQTKNINPDCILSCDSILKIDTIAGQVNYSLLSLVDQNSGNIYDIKFLGNSDWWQIFPSSRKINYSELFTKNSVGFLFKKLE